MRIVLVSAGLSEPSSSRLLGDRLVQASVDALHGRGETVEVEVVELRELAVDLAHQLVDGYPTARLSAAFRQVTGADGLVVVGPVFNGSYSGLFKTFVDALPVGSLEGVPVLPAATGGSLRHALVVEHAIRPLFAYLRSAVTATSVFAAPEDWAEAADLDLRITRAGTELANLMTSAARERYTRPLRQAV